MQEWLSITEAARLAKVSSAQWLHKLIKKEELEARYEQRGTLKYWYVNINCARFQRLLGRLEEPAPEGENQESDHPIDWEIWESMCRRGEEIVTKPCTSRTIQNYKDWIGRFYKQYSKLNRDTLRKALAVYEAKETPERDYYWTKTYLFFAMLTVAKYFVYQEYEPQEFVKKLQHLRPQKKHRITSRPCFTEGHIKDTINQVQNAKTKKNAPVYTEYNTALNIALLNIAFFTGARSSEICGIRIKDIDFDQGSIRLFGKGGKERFVGINKELKQSLKNYYMIRKSGISEQFFVCDKGTALNRDYIYRRIKRAGKWIETPLAPHAIRRTAITHMLTKKNIPMPLVRDAVGHSTLAVTNLYARPTANDVIQAMKEV